jgi:uncharacterized protein YggE
MKRLLLASAALFSLVALAGAVGLPDLAGAEDASESVESITVSGLGKVKSVPDEAQMSFGVETHGATAKAAVAANADEMRRIVNALRRAGGRELATQWVSVYSISASETGSVTAYSASNSVSVTSDTGDAAGLIDAATAAGANQVSGPGLTSSNTEELYRQALAKAVDEARARAQVLAKASGRQLGEITAIVEGGATQPPLPYAAERALDASVDTPIVAGTQETTATISVTFSLR